MKTDPWMNPEQGWCLNLTVSLCNNCHWDHVIRVMNRLKLYHCLMFQHSGHIVKRIISVLFTIILLTTISSAQGNCDLPSIISSDLVLIDTCTYTAPGTITINSEVTLTINAGVVLLLPQGANIQVNGSLIINGTEADPVFLQNLNAEEK